MKKKKHNRRPFFRFVKMIGRLIVKKPTIEYLGEKPNSVCILLSNHSGASGPANLELYLPTQFRMWGTFENCESLTEITMPKALLVLSEGVFKGCTNLQKIIFKKF